MSDSDTWGDIQAIKNKQTSLREKLARRKKERQEVVAEIIGGGASVAPVSVAVKNESELPDGAGTASSTVVPTPGITSLKTSSSSSTLQVKETKPLELKSRLPAELLIEVEKSLLGQLTDITLNLPVDLNSLYQVTLKVNDFM